MLMVESMELVFNREANRRERLWFVRYYANWVRKVQNRVWSREQAKFIDSLILNARNFYLSPKGYLKMKENGSKIRREKLTALS